MVLTPKSFADAFLNFPGDGHLKNLSHEIQWDEGQRVAEGGYSDVFRGRWRRPDVRDDTTTVGFFLFLIPPSLRSEYLRSA
jgi:hypothetical protein